MDRRSFLLAGAALAAAPDARAQLPPGPWPQFRGPGGLGLVNARGLPVQWGPGRGIVWKTDLPGAGTSSPVVIGDRIYLTAYTGEPGSGLRLHLLAMARADGRVLWKKDIAPRLPEQGQIREGHGWASSTVAADRERIFAFFGKTGVLAFDPSGRQLWQTDVGSGLNGWGSSNSPILFGNLVIVNASVESESLVALDRNTGREVWRARGIQQSWNTPVLVPVGDGRTQLVVAVFGKVLGLDPQTGRQVWSCNTDIGWYMVPSVVHGGGVVYCIGGRTGGALAIRMGGTGDVTGTHRLWTMRKGSNVSSPVLVGSHLYWVHENLGVAYCVEASTGRLVYEERLPGSGQIYASALAGDGKLYYVGRNGRVFVLAAAPRFQVLGSSDMRDGGVFNASPAAAGGQLLIRSDRALYCVGV